MSDAAESTARACVAVAVVEGEDLSAVVGAHFGRSPRFLLVREGVVETLENAHAEAAQGAGPATVSLLVRHGVTAVVAGQFGPKADDALRTGGIAAYAVRPGTRVADALERLRSGALELTG
jgi:predicted Fe-Mo cluster-binding NifX family protein